MNERIKELTHLAFNEVRNTVDINDPAWKELLSIIVKDNTVLNAFKEKFAELIINECMNQVIEQYIPVLEDKEMMKDAHWDGYVQCGIDSVVGIREYFLGVEE